MNVFSTDQTICTRYFSYLQLKLYNPYIMLHIMLSPELIFCIFVNNSISFSGPFDLYSCLHTLCWWHWKCFKTELFRNTIREVKSLFWKMTASIHQEHPTNFSIIITSFTLILFMFSPSQLLTSKLRISQHGKS